MAELLKGAPVAATLNAQTATEVAALQKQGVTPTLAIVRVGERSDDLSYERGATKRCREVGIEVRSIILPADTDSDTFFAALDELNRNPAVHGILLLRPLPKHLDEERARKMLRPEKDVDGCTDGSLAGVFTDTPLGFPPCTAQAAMEILRYYGIPLSEKRVVVIGRSLVVGRPVAMLLLHANATVTVCHSRTPDVPAITQQADVIIAASGRMESIGAAYLRAGQTVIDVGIGWNETKQKLCGDVNFAEAEPILSAITPVPGGVGSVTTAVLCRHIAEAAKRTLS